MHLQPTHDSRQLKSQLEHWALLKALGNTNYSMQMEYYNNMVMKDETSGKVFSKLLQQQLFPCLLLNPTVGILHY